MKVHESLMIIKKSFSANVQLVAPPTSASGNTSGNVALVQSDAGNYQIISSDDDSSAGVPTGSANANANTTTVNSNIANASLTANIANLQNLPAGTQLQFQQLTQQQQQIGYAGLKSTPSRNNTISMGTTRQGVQQVRLCLSVGQSYVYCICCT